MVSRSIFFFGVLDSDTCIFLPKRLVRVSFDSIFDQLLRVGRRGVVGIFVVLQINAVIEIKVIADGPILCPKGI